MNQLLHFLPSKSKDALAIDWVDTAVELVPQDRSVWLSSTGACPGCHALLHVCMLPKARRSLQEDAVELLLCLWNSAARARETRPLTASQVAH